MNIVIFTPGHPSPRKKSFPPALTAPYLAALAEHGVLALSAGANVMRFLPPLVITEEEVDEVVAAVDAAVRRP